MDGRIKQMKQIPNKWKKHLTLVEFGLKRENDLNREIKRYHSNEILKLIDDLYQNFEMDDSDSAYIISLIPNIDYFKLPNYLVKSKEQIDGILEFAENKKGSFSEIWCCEKSRRKGMDNVIGRIALKTNMNYAPNESEHMIEQVWSINHRDIERYSLSTKMNYLRTSRDGWHRRYYLDSINIVNPDDKEIILNDFFCVVKNIEDKRDKIENLLEYLKQIDISEISLEYMLNGDKFKFIDWDTSNDKKVIDSIFKEKLERE